jgi:hypothetical protein
MRTIVRVLVRVVAILVLAVLAYAFLPAVGDVSGKALDASVTREVGGSKWSDLNYPCRHRGEHAWTCEVSERQGSGAVSYRVTMPGSRCWRATKLSSGGEEGPPLEKRPTGCVKLRDQIRPIQRVVSSIGG